MTRMNLAGRLRRVRDLLEEPLLDLACRILMGAGGKRTGRRPFGAEELKLLVRSLAAQNLFGIGGKMVPAFEREFALAYGVPYAVGSTSGTAAIHLAVGALDLNPGDEVITSPITDLGTIIPILYQGAIPVFADIDGTYTLDPADVERKITSDTRAIIAVHLFGNACDMEALTDIARRHRVALIEDAAQAHMTRYRERLLGTIGDFGCFSFQQSKPMTTGDGGMTVTADEAAYQRMSLFVDKGYARKGWGPRAYLFHAPNYRMTELVGAVGRAQLRKVSGVVRQRARLGAQMTALVERIPGLRPAPVTPGAEHTYWMYPVWVEAGDVGRMGETLARERIPVLPGYIGKPIYLCSESLAAKKTYGDSHWPFSLRPDKAYEYAPGLCPRAEETLEHLLCIAWDESWTPRDVERVARALEGAGRTLAPVALTVPRLGQLEAVRPVPASGDGGLRHRLRIGVVGCGQVGRWHLDAYRMLPTVELVACTDVDAARAAECAQRAGARPYTSHRAMLAGERLDGVSLCTVPATHHEIALDLLDAGVPVLCEKPLAVSLEEARAMAARADARGVLLVPAFKFRFHEEVGRARELLTRGVLGEILAFRVMFGGPANVRGTWYVRRSLSGGGVIMDIGPHAVDLIRFLLGEIEDVRAEVILPEGWEVEPTARLAVRLVGGATGVVDLSWTVPVPSPAYLEIYGDRGALLLDRQGLSYRLAPWAEWKRLPNTSTAEQAFARQLAHFADGLTGRGEWVLGASDGVRAQALIEAAYASLVSGSAVAPPAPHVAV